MEWGSILYVSKAKMMSGRTGFWRLLGRLRERECHHKPSLVSNTDVPLDLLNERPNEAITERSFPQARHPDPIIPDDQFDPSWLAAACLDEDRP